MGKCDASSSLSLSLYLSYFLSASISLLLPLTYSFILSPIHLLVLLSYCLPFNNRVQYLLT